MYIYFVSYEFVDSINRGTGQMIITSKVKISNEAHITELVDHVANNLKKPHKKEVGVATLNFILLEKVESEITADHYQI